MGLEAQVGEALEGGVRYHLAGLDFRVALVLGFPGLVASSGPGKIDLQLSNENVPRKKPSYEKWNLTFGH